MNLEGFQQLKRVVSSVPASEFDMGNWNSCACAHATRDAWFRDQGFTHCNDFCQAAAFFGISRGEAEDLFSGKREIFVTPAGTIERIDRFLKGERRESQTEALDLHARRQAVINNILAKANRAAHKARKVATSLAALFF